MSQNPNSGRQSFNSFYVPIHVGEEDESSQGGPFGHSFGAAIVAMFNQSLGEIENDGGIADMQTNFYPVAESAAECMRCFLKIEHHISKLKSAAERLGRSLPDLPEKLAYGKYNFGTFSVYALAMAGELEKPLGTKDYKAMENIGLRICKDAPQPPSVDEWSKMWMEQKGLVDREALEGTDPCSICLERMTIVTIPCKHSFCAQCILSGYYTNSDQTTKSCAACPLCRGEYKIGDILLSKDIFIETQISKCAVGARASKGPCGQCQKPADSHKTCCEKATKELICAECLFARVYDEEIAPKDGKCNFCEKRCQGFVVYRPFEWSHTDTKQKKKKAKR